MNSLHGGHVYCCDGIRGLPSLQTKEPAAFSVGNKGGARAFSSFIRGDLLRHGRRQKNSSLEEAYVTSFGKVFLDGHLGQ
ncbi:hypothetical protein Q3G72_018905 [Acer saccharum]|nr:hypothetical protein Q3G72_018905 [Acer saccharum]